MVARTDSLERYIEGVRKRNPGETEFHQAVYEVAASIIPYIQDKPRYQEMQILERMAEPDRTVIFRVCWEDDKGNILSEEEIDDWGEITFVPVPDWLEAKRK